MAKTNEYRSPLEMPMLLPAIAVCPCCGGTPAIDPALCGLVCIYCDSDECFGKDIQACEATLGMAAETWNQRVAEGF